MVIFISLFITKMRNMIGVYLMNSCPKCHQKNIQSKKMIYILHTGKIKNACKPPYMKLSIIFILMLIIFFHLFSLFASVFKPNHLAIVCFTIPLLLILLLSYRKIYQSHMALYHRQWLCLSCGIVFEKIDN